MDHYEDSDVEREAIDGLQWTFQCCGLNGKDDWLSRPGRNASTTYPSSCCDGFKSGDRTPCHEPHSKHCLREVEQYFYSVANSAAIAGIIVAIIQVAAIVSSCILAQTFKKRYNYV